MLSQIAIGVFGVSAIYLVNHENQELHKWGPVMGLINQPFWLYTTITAEQWGIVVLCAFYTYAWWKGLKTRWFNA